jgi:prephenate dehydrogenase
MAQFDHIAIIGIGLIGGSFALALRAAGFDGRITGWDNRKSLEYAIENSIIDAPEESFGEDRRSEADLIYLAMPISAILEFLDRHGHQIKEGALVTDSGSTKRAICRVADRLPSGIDFIGGHPMAGSEQSGGRAARVDLFTDAIYIIVPRTGVEETRILQFELLLHEIGAQPIRLSAEAHDEAIAMVSHLPQLLSTALVSVVNSSKDTIDPRQLAGPGFRDMSRLASSPWSVWRDICATNRDSIAAALDEMIRTLADMRSALDEEQMKNLKDCFLRAAKEI